jgi:diguanylate cyclase (GGDEF)-like protein
VAVKSSTELAEHGPVDSLDHLVRIDALTGVFNRVHLTEQLHALTAASRRERTPVAVALFDVDGLGGINLRHGRTTGDAVLRAVAERITDQVRAGAVIGRWDAEEFLVVMPNTGLAGVVAATERVVAHVAATPIVTVAGDVPVTISGGCTAEVAPRPDRLLMVADVAMYQAKSAGHGRAVAMMLDGTRVS